jgi:hypothetical protein
LTHFFTRLNGSAEARYRFYHDDWGIFAHTLGLLWNQKVGDALTLSPMFRYYRQSAASFYAPGFDGFPDHNPSGALIVNGQPQDLTYVPQPGDVIQVIPGYPQFYSSDYRLSEMETFTFAVGLHWHIYKYFSFDAGYQRYLTRGLDGVTPASTYPNANIYTVGVGIAW